MAHQVEFIGGPLDGEVRVVEGDVRTIQIPMHEPLTVQNLEDATFDVPETVPMWFLTYERVAAGKYRYVQGPQ